MKSNQRQMTEKLEVPAGNSEEQSSTEEAWHWTVYTGGLIKAHGSS